MSEPNNSNPFATSTTISYSYTVDTRLRCDKDYVSSMDGIAKLLTQVSALKIQLELSNN